MADPEYSVLFQCGSVRLPRAALRGFASELQHTVAGGRPFDILITRDAELRRLNREFLGHDYPTDVLSFPSGARDGFLGEIAISVDRAREQAAEQGHGADVELRILMLHGVLHLTGMDHERDGGRMRRAEARWRKQFGQPSGLIERAHA
jgi:probable rRNA maturation factor